MIRGILRNVQYLFLFFSVLLVFLALQRLQYLPQHYNYSVEGATVGGAASIAEFDKPPLSSSNELKSLYYYRGDETKEIGLRSFRVGVFKFILPSFSSSSSASTSASSSYHRSTSSSRNENNDSYYLTVPPPNDKPNKSVAYILDLSTTTTRQLLSSAIRSTDTTTTTIANKAKTLSKSIQRMHAGSKYGYKLYALVNSKEFLRSLSSTEEEGVGSSRRMNWLSKLGFEIIDSTLYEEKEEREGINSIGDETNTSHKLSRGGSSTNKHYFLYKIWKRHDIIIHLLSAGMELHSSWTLDGLFDILVSNNKNNNNSNNSSSSSNNNRRFPGIDSFLLQPHHSYTSKRRNEKNEEEEIFIFNGSSHQAYETYRKFLSCLTTADNQSTERKVLDVAANNEIEEEGNVSHRCMDEIDSDRGLAMCMYHEDFIDCSESMLAKEKT
jgi:hypothetical protein